MNADEALKNGTFRGMLDRFESESAFDLTAFINKNQAPLGATRR